MPKHNKWDLRFTFSCLIQLMRDLIQRNILSSSQHSHPQRLSEILHSIVLSGCQIPPSSGLGNRLCCYMDSVAYGWIEKNVACPPTLPSFLLQSESSLILTVSFGDVITDWTGFTDRADHWLRDHFSIAAKFNNRIQKTLIPKTLTEYHRSAKYVLESQLGSRLRLKDPLTSPAGVFKGSQKVYLRDDCVEVLSKKQWAERGRAVLTSERTLYLFRQANNDELYALEETEKMGGSPQTFPTFGSVTEENGFSKFIEADVNVIKSLQGRDMLLAPVKENGLNGVLAYAPHVPIVLQRIKELTSCSIGSLTCNTVAETWGKLLRRILIDKIVEERYLQKQ